jgi:hypothetical protein
MTTTAVATTTTTRTMVNGVGGMATHWMRKGRGHDDRTKHNNQIDHERGGKMVVRTAVTATMTTTTMTTMKPRSDCGCGGGEWQAAAMAVAVATRG